MKPVPSTAVSTRRRVLRALTAGRGARRPWLPALVAALVVGILGMHALVSHGAPSAAAAPASTMAAMSTPAGHDAAMAAGTSDASHHHAAAAAHTAMAAAGTSVNGDFGSGHGSGHGMAGMVMLCVVMLAAAALTLLVVLAARLFRPLLPAAFMPAAVRERALQWVRGTGPPYEWQFSVIRC